MALVTVVEDMSCSLLAPTRYVTHRPFQIVAAATFTTVSVFVYSLYPTHTATGDPCPNFISMTTETKAMTKIFANVEGLPSLWGEGCDVCEWDSSETYLICENNDLTYIDLSSLNLNGTLTVGTYSFPNELRYLNLGYNNLSGTISWGGMGLHLEWLDLGYNRFTGTIEIHQLSDNIEYVYLRYVLHCFLSLFHQCCVGFFACFLCFLSGRHWSQTMLFVCLFVCFLFSICLHGLFQKKMHMVD